MPTILQLTAIEAKSYFMEERNYVSFELPPYFTFQEILNKIALKLGGSQISSYYRHEEAKDGKPARTHNPNETEGVNYRLLAGKDGAFAWRPFEVIHPALYVALVNEITTQENWEFLLSKFNEFSHSLVRCESIPFQSEDKQSHKAKQISRWWTNVEQASIKLGLKYQYVFDADITDCYGAIYTHSISWALHGKEVMKVQRINSDYLGNRIDWLIQKMRYGQTNGIPQGSVIMDFIAEILLGHIDVELTTRLSGVGPDSFKIIRYRDDYKVFTNDPELGRRIIKELSELLSTFGMKLNTDKTKMRSDPILASVKPDKIFELTLPKNKLSFSKRLLFIYAAINEQSNSGMATRLLDKFLVDLESANKLGDYDDVDTMISIIVNIAYNNPRTHPHCTAILSHLLKHCSAEHKLEVVGDIVEKFGRIPNTGLLDIWLQRISYKIKPSLEYSEMLTKVVSGDLAANTFWQSGWLKDDVLNIVNKTSIINRTKLDEMSPLVPSAEVSLYSLDS